MDQTRGDHALQSNAVHVLRKIPGKALAMLVWPPTSRSLFAWTAQMAMLSIILSCQAST